MDQSSATQLQVEALKRSILLEHDRYTLAVEAGENANTLQDISEKIRKLIFILECVYTIDVENKRIIAFAENEFAEINNHKIAS